MEFTAAIVQNDGNPYVVVIVRREVLEDSFSINQARDIFKKFFPLYPIILMAQDAHGEGVFEGQKDIVKSLNGVKPERLPWQTYTVKS